MYPGSNMKMGWVDSIKYSVDEDIVTTTNNYILSES